MPWLQIKIPTLPAHTEALEDALLIAGCQAVTLLDTADVPVFEPIRGTTPLWEHTTIQGLFEDDVDSKQLVATMRRLADENQMTVGNISTEILEDKDWEREWMDNFKPIQCGEKLWIVPSWLEAPAPSAVNLKLDPGLAFGTGTHPTTYLCLKWMDEHLQSGDRILDFGCGSGILGLAGILLGAEHMDGIDIDPQALTATQNNAKTNSIDESKFMVTTQTDELAEEYDKVIANILAGTLVDLSETIVSKLRKGGHIVLSGILNHQADTVLNAFNQVIDFQPISEKDGWVCLSGQKK
jgi:ribosomal protein L11 methyltransferase